MTIFVNLSVSLACNIGEILTMFLAMLVSLPVPLVAIQILWINLVTDGLPAMALGIDPVDPEVMTRPPRDPQEYFCPWPVGKILGRGVPHRHHLRSSFCWSLHQGARWKKLKLGFCFFNYGATDICL